MIREVSHVCVYKISDDDDELTFRVGQEFMSKEELWD